MNDLARDLLVAAELRDHPTVRGRRHGLSGGECALGVLHLAMHPTREEAVACGSACGPDLDCQSKMGARFALAEQEQLCIIYAFDSLHWSFLDIALKELPNIPYYPGLQLLKPE